MKWKAHFIVWKFKWERILIPLYFLKTSNFHSPRSWEEWEGMKLDLMIFFTKTPKRPLYIQSFILK